MDAQPKRPATQWFQSPFLWLLLVATSAVYALSFRVPFLYDDIAQIATNTALQKAGNLKDLLFSGMRQIRVIQNLLFAFDWKISNGAPWSFHLTNLILHLINVALLYRFLDKAIHKTENRLLILIVTALFALHPLQTEAVAYVMGRVSLLQCFFYLAVLNCLIENTRRATLAAYALFSFSLLAKESCLLIAPLIVSYRLIVEGRKWRELGRSELLILAMICALYPLLSFVLRDPDSMYAGTVGFSLFPVGQYIVTQGYYYLLHIALVFVPSLQSAYHEHPDFSASIAVLGVTGLLVYAGSIVGAYRVRKTYPLVSFFIVLYLITMAATNTILQMINPLAEYRLYQANIALFFLPALAIIKLIALVRSPMMKKIVGASVGAYFVLFTVLQIMAWRNPAILYSRALDHYPRSHTIHELLGVALADQQNFTEAEAHFLKAGRLAEAAGNRATLRPRFLLAKMYMSAHRYEDAIRTFQEIPLERLTLGIVPKGYFDLYLLGLRCVNDPGRFNSLRQQALNLFPGNQVLKWDDITSCPQH